MKFTRYILPFSISGKEGRNDFPFRKRLPFLKEVIRYSTLLLFILITPFFKALPQGIQDSIFQISPVQITAKNNFKKEEGGMKETKVDSIVLSGKVNLSLSELLSENTPIFIKTHGRGALATASFRGTAASHTNVNWNGININSPMSGMVDFSLIPVYIIDDLNLKHGAASITDQSGGLGGSINLNNTVDWDNTFNLKYMQGVGSYRTFDEFLKFGFGNKKVQSKTRIYHNYSKNDFTFINRGIGNIDPKTGNIINPLDTNHNADYKKYGLLQEIYFRPTEISTLSVKYWGQYANRTIPRPTSYEGPENSNLNKQKDIAHKIVADWKKFGDNSKLVIRSAYSGKETEYYVKNNISGLGTIPAIYSVSSQNGFLNSGEYIYNFKSNFSVEAKINANYYVVSSEDTVSKTGYQKNRFELSSFLGLRKNFADRLNLNLMLRQEWIDNKKNPIIPYFGFDFKLLKSQHFFLKGNIARNYHNPTLNDLYWQPGGNPELLPEHGISYEIGLEYTASRKNNQLTTEITAYQADIDNWIIWIPNYKGYWEPQNIKRVLSKGVEFVSTLNGEFKKISYKIATSYSYTSSINYGDPVSWGDDSYGKQLVYIPLLSGNAMVNLFYKKFYFTYQYNAYSERYTTSSNDKTERKPFYPYFMNDIILGKNFQFKNLNLTTEFKIYNLFNETYHSVIYRPMPKRNYMLLIMINF